MSSPQYATTPTGFPHPAPATFTASNTTIAKVLVDLLPAAVAASPLPAYYGGCTVIDLIATSSDSVARDVQAYIGTVATTVGASTTGAVTTTTSTIPRVSGSFIADGWLVGDLVMTFTAFGTAPNVAVDGILGVVTTVAALTLTLSGTPIAALALATGTRIVKVTPRLRVTVPLGAGTTSGVGSQGMLNQSIDGATLKYEIKLGPNNMLITAMAATISALPVYVSIDPTIATY